MNENKNTIFGTPHEVRGDGANKMVRSNVIRQNSTRIILIIWEYDLLNSELISNMSSNEQFDIQYQRTGTFSGN